MLQPILCGDCNVECTAGRYCAANARHDDAGNLVELDVGCGLWNEQEALVETEKVTFVGLDAALHTSLLMMAAYRQWAAPVSTIRLKRSDKCIRRCRHTWRIPSMG